MAVNMWYERDIDPLMERTENRPIQSGFISAEHALLFGITISCAGVALVTLLTNINAGMLNCCKRFVLHSSVYNASQTKDSSEYCDWRFSRFYSPAIGWAAASNKCV